MVQEVITGKKILQYRVVELKSYDPENGLQTKFYFEEFYVPVKAEPSEWPSEPLVVYPTKTAASR